MAEDKRITKTKTELRRTLVSLIQSSSFEKITVKEICATARISRLTFYANYRDKYDLVNDFFHNLKEQVLQKCHERNLENNPSHDLTITTKNLIHVIVDYFYDNASLVSAVNYEKNPYVRFAFHTFLETASQELITDKVDPSHLRYPVRVTAGFLCNGMASFLATCFEEGTSREETQERCVSLIDDLLSEKVILK